MTAATATPRRLYRSTRDKKVAGVCGGIAEAMGWDVTAVRLVAVLSILLPGPQVLAYLVAWAIMPLDEEVFGWNHQGSMGGHATAEDIPPMPNPPVDTAA